MRRAAVGLALVSVLAAAGCGGGGTPDAGPPASSSPPAATPTPPPAAPELPDPRADVPSDVPTERDPLADAAEAAASAAAESGDLVLGGDISWPQCPEGMGIPERPTMGLPMPKPEARYVIIGLTNGPAFFPNPCLADQVAWVRQRGLMVSAYSVLSHPNAATLRRHGGTGPFDGGDRLGALKNVGYQQARFNVRNMERAGLLTPMVWLDVESVPGFDWTGDRQANAAVVQGAFQGYRDAGYSVGVYSTPAIWAGIVGDLSFGVPEWRAAGPTGLAEALERCGDDWSIQGGPGVLGQWVEDDRDLNTTCPGTSGDLSGLFHQF
ncbi:hypothetical protein [Nocardioides sp. SYSU D00038]|uniref:hypothetical protein n=1 Tax=Nocardioides sp. SYSU D00038 TaxID=2812554 RepID=UPI0019676172|nr:hypothetical protein [Nocardioides sp. SYSU D00038]